MTDILERKKKLRGPVRSTTTRLMNQIERQLQGDPQDKATAEELLEKLTRKEQKLNELDAEILSLVEQENLEEEVSSIEEYMDQISVWKVRLNRCLRNATQRGEQTDEATPADRRGKVTVKLPRLVIDVFYGDSATWQNFWSQFESAIHQNDALSNVDKFNYLKSFLGGSAAKSIFGLSLTDDNYDTAIKILTDRFGRRDMIISAHMNHLLNIPKVKRSSDVSLLRRLYDECEIQVRSLEALGMTSEKYGSLLCPILMKLIPPDLALEFSKRKDEEKDWDVSDLLTFLRKEVEGRERANCLLDGEEKEARDNKEKTRRAESDNQKQNKRTNSRISSAAALNATTENSCLYCESTEHAKENCVKSVEEKRAILKRERLCFVCLRKGHVARFCRYRRNCSKCGRRHHITICDSIDTVVPQNSITVVSSVSGDRGVNSTMILQTAQAVARGEEKELLQRCLLDTGSQRSFIRADISKALKLPVTGEETLTIHTFGSEQPVRVTRRKVKVILENKRNPHKSIELELLESPEISGALIQVPSREIQNVLHTQGMQLADEPEDLLVRNTRSQITILIGTDYYWQVVTGKVQRLGCSLVAVETIFGWSIHGPMSVHGSTCNSTNMMKIAIDSESNEEEMASSQLKKFWDLETLGIVDISSNEKEETAEATEIFEKTVKYKDGRYCVGLPWKPNSKANLRDNFQVAKHRLGKLAERLKRDPNLCMQYNDTIQTYIEEGIVEQVDTENSTEIASPVFYLPHQAVRKEERLTTKLRVVFDASSHEKGVPSLNDCLYPGPNLNPDIFELLLKFREKRTAFTADIERAFLQIELAEQDRDVARFLWFKDPAKGYEKNNIVTLRLTRVLFGVTSSPFLLAATIKHHVGKFTNEFPEACQLLDESLYVDDLLGSVDEIKEAKKLTEDCRKVMNTAGMKLCKWQTNSRNLRDYWKEEGMATEAEYKIIAENVTSQKVLGVSWNSEKDTLFFDVTQLLKFLKDKANTKRFILQASGRIFDPLGIVSPYTVRVKILFQELWVKGLDWDDQLPNDVEEIWNQWCYELTAVNGVSIQRHYFQGVSIVRLRDIQLHVFTDASIKAYGAVCYIRHTDENNKTVVNFVCSKSRVTPLKKLTLPRLELMAALIGARLSKRIRGCLSVGLQCRFWSDSMIALFWITSPAYKYKPFVENRVTEIQLLTEPSDWSHCAGKENPADFLTRGVSLNNLTNNEIWWHGPDWLSKEEKNWPQRNMLENKPKHVEMEIRANFKSDTETTNNCVLGNFVKGVPELLDVEKYSNLRKLLRVTAWVKRFAHNTRKPEEKLTGVLTVEEISNAEEYWIKRTQESFYGNEIILLKNSQPVSTISKIADLNPILDEKHLIRVGGRIQKSNFSFGERHPIILPASSKYAELVIESGHRIVLHCGISDTLAQIRKKYWIPKGRQRVKKVLNNCLVCRKYVSKPATQITAPLPRDRITESPPFTVSAVDFAGPLYTRKNKTEKAYIALFTCAVTRAVHLELVTDLSTDKFLLAFRRFVARRGVCTVMYSDNAKTFKRAEKELRKLWQILKTQEIQEYFVKHEIKWKYIVERASWWGGFWERMVRSVKMPLKKVLGNALLSFEELATILTEIEAVLNSRPLTYSYNDVKEPEPLTPAHFLAEGNLNLYPPWDPEKFITTSTAEKLHKRVKYRRQLLNRIWKRWKSQYLMEIRSAYYVKKEKKPFSIKENEVVLIEEGKPRQLWKMGIVKQLFHGRDGLVRSCLLRTNNGTLLRRPIQMLYPLELH